MSNTLPPLPPGNLNVCVVGPGAIGGTIAARLAMARDHGLGKISVIARGAHLQAIRDYGLRLKTPVHPEPIAIPVTAVENPAELPPQDVVITALKGHQIPAMAGKLATLLASHGRIVPVVNGLPWWYPLPDGKGGVQGAPEVDPKGRLWRLVGAERAIGAIAYMGASVPEPGLIQVEIDGYLDLGRLPGQPREDVERLAQLLRDAGLTIRETEPFQNSLFSKLFSNCALNSVAALSGLTQAEIMADPTLRQQAAAIMEEVRALAKAEGAEIRMTTEKRLELAARDPGFKPSTLQDLEKGRPMEVEPIFGATVALARARGVPCPVLEAATEKLRAIERQRGFAD
ncbi:2-dehydropantoate 2-reductase [Pseudooceanicola sp.]|uniref:ketopantoate reductase family protein n=1 Tax=Pseudooceanicola sp. TaxID=1914328 RepID=UPI002626B984|nr:2-dehydropantoate 2-reductase [Pseudooceanicola sp.]MDF1855643.1 2-dehydropantoate 2-reductase [Pseudooceanicola sp.]